MLSPLLELHDGYVAAIDANRRQAIETADPEAFHDLRVAAKRERALLRFVAALGVGLDAKRAFRTFRTLFRAAGGVRDLHIQQEVARRLAPRGARSYQRALRERLDEALWEFSQVPPPSAAAVALLRSQIGAALAGIDDALAAPIAEGHLRRLESELARLKSLRGALHELRIAMKDVLYTSHFIERSCPGVAIAKDREPRLQRLQRMLGNWHDLEIALASGASLGDPLEGAIRDAKESSRRRIRYAIRALL